MIDLVLTLTQNKINRLTMRTKELKMTAIEMFVALLSKFWLTKRVIKIMSFVFTYLIDEKGTGNVLKQ